MKRVFKNRVFLVIITALICITGSVCATTILARDISYGNTNVESALNDLYDKADSKKICELKSGTANSIGSMYECDPGDNVKRNFYILEVRNNEVDLIMQHNITEGSNQTTMTWNDAMKYIKNNNLKTSWDDVMNVDLPSAQAIANAVGRSNWHAGDNSEWWCLETKQQDTSSSPYCYNNTTNTLWLWDYTRECASHHCEHSLSSTEAYGYWTRDLISNSANAWTMIRNGCLGGNAVSSSTNNGVRLVITVSKNQLLN